MRRTAAESRIYKDFICRSYIYALERDYATVIDHLLYWKYSTVQCPIPYKPPHHLGANEVGGYPTLLVFTLDPCPGRLTTKDDPPGLSGPPAPE
jgi:hypothetical protein